MWLAGKSPSKWKIIELNGRFSSKPLMQNYLSLKTARLVFRKSMQTKGLMVDIQASQVSSKTGSD